MRIYRVLFLLPVLMVLMGAGAATPSGTRQAKCVVDVWSNLDFGQALYTGHASYAYDDVKVALCQEMGPQAHEMLGIAPETLPEYVTFEPTVAGDPQKSTTLGQGSGQRSRLTLGVIADDERRTAIGGSFGQDDCGIAWGGRSPAAAKASAGNGDGDSCGKRTDAPKVADQGIDGDTAEDGNERAVGGGYFGADAGS